jgi:anti-sigma regulatory factor (Ser/Thr protein kinase)
MSMDALAPGAARRFVQAHLVAWGCEDALDHAQLVVSELVTNAVVHARSHPHLLLAYDAVTVRLEVVDDSASAPIVRDPDDWAESGRGMFLVDALSTGWGVEIGERGKRIWVDLPCAEVSWA